MKRTSGSGGGVVWNGTRQVFEQWTAEGFKAPLEMVFRKGADSVWLVSK